MRYLILLFALLVFGAAHARAETESYATIFLAIQNDDIEAVQKFIEESPGLVGEPDKNAMTPLFYAAYYGKTEIVKLLIAKGSDVNYRRINGETSLHMAANFNHVDIVKLLVENGADIHAGPRSGMTPIRYAINGGAKETAEFLLEKGAVIPEDGSLFHTAAKNGMGRIVEEMRAKGIVPDDDDGNGGTILHSAAAGGLVDLSQKALSEGLHVNAPDRYGVAPIHLAAIGGHMNMVRFLLDNGADINPALPDGRTPCHLAGEHGHDDITQLLVDRGAGSCEVLFMPVTGDIYFGEKKPDLAPLLFARGIVSTAPWQHGAPAFSPKGDVVYWEQDFRTHFYTAKTKGKWSIPGPSPLFDEYGASNPVFSHDGSKLYFHSTSTMTDDGKKRDADIWVVGRAGGGWGEPRNLGPAVNGREDDRFASVARDGTIYFTSGYDIYRSRFEDGVYAGRERLSEQINTENVEMSPCIAPDEKFLIFESNRPGGFAEFELYICFKENDGSFSAPRNMGSAINAGGSRFPGLSPDGRYLFFTSTRNGNSDVYWVDVAIIDQIREIEVDDIHAALHDAVIRDGADAAIELYRRLKRKHPDYYDFREFMLNRLGYDLLNEERYEAAIAIFKLNVEAYPGSGNVYDSLGEAYMKNADFERAVINYKESLVKNPANDNARVQLEKLERKSVTTVSAAGLTFERSPQNFYPRCTNDASLGDIDGDGDLDVVCSNMTRNYSRVWFNDGAGRLTQSDQELTVQGHGVELADLDGDGDLDIFITCAGFNDGRIDYSEPTRIYLNDGRGFFHDSGQDLNDLELSGTGVALADVDRDGDLDAFVNYFQHENIIYLNDGNARFTKSDKTFPGAASIGDLDGDGDPDYFAKVAQKGYRTALNDGSGNFIDHWEMDDSEVQRGGDAGLADIDGDGDLDAVVANGSWRVEAAPTKLLLNDGTGSFVDSGITLPAVKSAGMAFGDLNHDGRLDVVVTDFELPNQIWLGTEEGRLVDSGIRLSFGEMFRHICLGDLDGDGDLDIFFANFNLPGRGGPNEIWFNR